MVEPVDALAQSFAKAGANIVTFHPEATRHVERSLSAIRDAGCQAGLVFNPATPLSILDWVLDKVDMVLLMSVNPGFGGQGFLPSTLAKLKAARRRLDAYHAETGRFIPAGNRRWRESRQHPHHRRSGADAFVAGRRCSGLPARTTKQRWTGCAPNWRLPGAGDAGATRLAAHHRLIPYPYPMTASPPPPPPRVAVTRRLPGDLDTPLGVYLKLASGSPTPISSSRWKAARAGGAIPSSACRRPRSCACGDGRATVTGANGTLARDEAAPDALAWLRAYAAPLEAAPAADLPRFAGGLVGYFTYDCVRLFEPR